MDNNGNPTSNNLHKVEPITSRMMIVSLALSVAGCCTLFALLSSRELLHLLPLELWLVILLLPGMMLGIVSLVQIARNCGRLVGMTPFKFIAVWVIPGVLTVVLFPVFVRPIGNTRALRCYSNLKQLALAATQYTLNNVDRLPPTDTWNDALSQRVKSSTILVCHSSIDHQHPSYAMNQRLKGLKLGDIKSPEDTVMFFESVSGKNMHGGPELLPPQPRHAGGDNIAFVDGHAKWYLRADTLKLNWDPRREVRK